MVLNGWWMAAAGAGLGGTRGGRGRGKRAHSPAGQEGTSEQGCCDITSWRGMDEQLCHFLRAGVRPLLLRDPFPWLIHHTSVYWVCETSGQTMDRPYSSLVLSDPFP